jgi:hypothetical protein
MEVSLPERGDGHSGKARNPSARRAPRAEASVVAGSESRRFRPHTYHLGGLLLCVPGASNDRREWVVNIVRCLHAHKTEGLQPKSADGRATAHHR